MIRTVYSLLALLLLPLCLGAQQETFTKVDLRFIFLDESPGAFEVKVDGDYVQVSSHPYAISQPVRVTPRVQLPVYKKVNTPEGEKRVSVANVSVDGDTASVLAVLAPRNRGGANSASYGVHYFKSNPSDFPEGSLRVLNLGRAPVALAFGQEAIVIEPGETHVMTPRPDRKNRFFARVAEKTNNGWKILYDNVSMMRPGERMTGVFVYSPSGMRHTFTEAELEVMGDPPPSHYWLSYSERVKE